MPSQIYVKKKFMLIKQTMLTVEQALAFLMDTVRPVTDIESIPTLQANGRVVAQPQISTIDVPPKDNTQMDGFAVRAADCTSGAAKLRISQRIPAGVVGAPLEKGTAARIFTGAMIPDGADAVVMQEQCVVDGDSVTITYTPKVGDWIRRQGEDIQRGNTILKAGTRLRPQELGLAASVGIAQLNVWRRLRVAVFFTGDELAMPGEVLKPGAIYNSNRFLLAGLLQNLGCEMTDYGIVPDTLEATRSTLRRAAQEHDLIITSGGVSVGEEDHIKPAVEAEGRINMWKIAVKPGKPLAFGEVNNAFFLGLPGNPVSSFVTFLLFVRPFILRMQQVDNIAPQSFWVRANFDWHTPDRRNEFLRAKINTDGGVDIFTNQGSGVLTSTVWGDGLIDVAPEQIINQGDLIRFIPFNSLLY